MQAIVDRASISRLWTWEQVAGRVVAAVTMFQREMVQRI